MPLACALCSLQREEKGYKCLTPRSLLVGFWKAWGFTSSVRTLRSFRTTESSSATNKAELSESVEPGSQHRKKEGGLAVEKSEVGCEVLALVAQWCMGPTMEAWVTEHQFSAVPSGSWEGTACMLGRDGVYAGKGWRVRWKGMACMLGRDGMYAGKRQHVHWEGTACMLGRDIACTLGRDGMYAGKGWRVHWEGTVYAGKG